MCFNCPGIGHRASLRSQTYFRLSLLSARLRAQASTEQESAKASPLVKYVTQGDNTQFQAQTREPGMTAHYIGNSAVIHPVVVVTMNGYKFRALLDSKASHLYASATAIDLINASLKSTGLRQIAMLTGVTTRTMQVFGVGISSVTGDFELEVDVTKVNKRELLI